MAIPPSTRIISPVMYLASSVERKVAKGAISSGSPNLCIGIQAITAFFCFSVKTSVVAVDIYPGATTLTVIFLVATSLNKLKI